MCEYDVLERVAILGIVYYLLRANLTTIFSLLRVCCSAGARFQLCLIKCWCCYFVMLFLVRSVFVRVRMRVCLVMVLIALSLCESAYI